MGAEVTLLQPPEKGEDARRLVQKRVVVSRDATQMAACQTSLDFIIDQVAAPHDLNPYLTTLKTTAAWCW